MMRYIKTLLVLFFIASIGQLNAQEDIDAQLQGYKTAMIDKKLTLFFSFFDKLGSIDRDSVLFYVKDLQSEGLKKDREDAIAMANLGMAPYLIENSLFNQANQKLNNAIKYYQKVENDTMLSTCYNSLGNVSFLEGKIKTAEELYMKSSEYAIRSGDERFLMGPMFNLGRVEVQQGKYKEAEKKINTYIDYLKKSDGSVRMYAAAYGLLGQLYLDQKEYNKAIQNFTQSMEFGLTVGSMKTVANGYTNLAIVEFYTENFERSEQYFQLALAYRIKDEDNYYIAEGYYNLGDFYYGVWKLDSALASYTRSADVAEKSSNYLAQKEALMQISGIYDTLGLETKQVEVLKKVIELQDKISKQQNSRELNAMRMSYEQTINEFLRNGKVREGELQKKVGSLNSVFNNWIVISIISVLCLIVLVFIIKRRTKT